MSKKNKINGKKIAHAVKETTLAGVYIASTTSVVCQCLTNPISTIGLIVKEGMDTYYESRSRKTRDEIIRKETREQVLDEIKNAAVVGPAA